MVQIHKQCPVCGIEFLAARKDKKYCSDKCRDKVREQSDKRKAYLKAYEQSDKRKAYHRAYKQGEKHMAYCKTYRKENCIVVNGNYYTIGTTPEIEKPLINALLTMRKKKILMKQGA